MSRPDPGELAGPGHGPGAATPDQEAATAGRRQARGALHQEVGTEHGDGIVVVGDHDRPQPGPLVVVERGELLVAVEDPDGPGGDQRVAALAIPLRDHFDSQGSPTHRARSMP